MKKILPSLKKFVKKTTSELNITDANRINSVSSKQNIIIARLLTLEMHKNLIRYVKYLNSKNITK